MTTRRSRLPSSGAIRFGAGPDRLQMMPAGPAGRLRPLHDPDRHLPQERPVASTTSSAARLTAATASATSGATSSVKTPHLLLPRPNRPSSLLTSHHAFQAARPPPSSS